jgi:hypothetical protein
MSEIAQNAFSDRPVKTPPENVEMKKPQDVMFIQRAITSDVLMTPKQIEEVRLREGLSMAGG